LLISKEIDADCSTDEETLKEHTRFITESIADELMKIQSLEWNCCYSAKKIMMRLYLQCWLYRETWIKMQATQGEREILRK